VSVFTIKESLNALAFAELDVIDEGPLGTARIRVRETHGKASIFLTVDELELLAERCLLVREKLLANEPAPTRPARKEE
jgi:hypothetical protein